MTRLVPQCPAPLAARGYGLRTEGPGDRPFLRALFAGLRATEFAALPFDEGQRAAFIDFQFDAQCRHYAAAYPGASFQLVTAGGAPAGRFCVGMGEGADVRILDISLDATHRGGGVGTALVGGLQQQAAALGLGVTLHVDKRNSAFRLYRRLGFAVTGDTGLSWRMDWRAGNEAHTPSPIPPPGGQSP